jgi:hypothetical protein
MPGADQAGAFDRLTLRHDPTVPIRITALSSTMTLDSVLGIRVDQAVIIRAVQAETAERTPVRDWLRR